MSANNEVAVPALDTDELIASQADMRSMGFVDEINEIVTFEEAFAAAGLDEADMTFVGSPYTILKNTEKDELLAKPVFVRGVRFAKDPISGQDYLVGYAVTRDGMFLFTDGSTGIYKQFVGEVNRRIKNNHPTPFENFSLANGLRKSEYGIDKDGVPVKPGEKADGKATTYYVA